MIETLRRAPHPFKGTEVHTFPNGLTCLLKSDPTIPAVALQIWARCGAIDESPNIYGISHGLEHMVFKGTPTRTAGEITRAIESKGGAINAATQLETTHYYIDIPSYGLKPALEVLIDTLLHPTFPQDELERERLVILEEIHRRDDSPDATLWDEFCSQVFQGSPYGIKVIGNEKTVSEMSREDLLHYFRAHYVPSKLCVVIAGDFDKKDVLKILNDRFGKVPARRPPSEPNMTPSVNGHPRTVIHKKPVQMAYFAHGLPTVGLGHPDSVALDVLSDALGGGASARLYQRLREEQQSVLSISCDYIAFRDKGLFAFFGETHPERADRASEMLTQQIALLKKDPLRPEELARAKARIKSEWLHGSETPHGQASTLGSLSTLGHLNLINSYLDNVEALTVDSLMQVYHRYLADQTFHVTRVEPGS